MTPKVKPKGSVTEYADKEAITVTILINLQFIFQFSIQTYLFLVASDGRVSHSEVKAFMKSQLTVITMYESITNSDNNTMSLTENHLMYARKSSAAKFNIM